jgi:hypothetical protein
MTTSPLKEIHSKEIPFMFVRKVLNQENFEKSYSPQKSKPTKSNRVLWHQNIRSELRKEEFLNFSLYPKKQKLAKKTKSSQPQKIPKKSSTSRMKKTTTTTPTSYFTNIREFMTKNSIFDESFYYNDVSFEKDENFVRKTRGKKQNWAWLNDYQKEDQSSKYFKILEIPKTATLEEIKKQYYKLSMKYHPDRNQNDEESTIKFQMYSDAYHTIMNLYIQK